jgi:hypothetical protein
VPWRPADDANYAYLLGWYLGDGCLCDVGRAFQLVITADLAYLNIVEECRWALVTAVPGRVARLRPHALYEYVRIESGWTRWPEVFPQHGPGRKHERPIVLAAWQQAIVESNARNISISHRRSVALLDEHVGPKT